MYINISLPFKTKQLLLKFHLFFVYETCLKTQGHRKTGKLVRTFRVWRQFLQYLVSCFDPFTRWPAKLPALSVLRAREDAPFASLQ